MYIYIYIYINISYFYILLRATQPNDNFYIFNLTGRPNSIQFDDSQRCARPNEARAAQRFRLAVREPDP